MDIPTASDSANEAQAQVPAPAGVHALLLTDVVDSTALAERLGDAAMAALWAAHDRAARDLLPRWRGREIDHSDGLLLLFDSAADGVGYALDYHRALAALPHAMTARAGLHVGAVLLRENSAADVALGAKSLEVDGIAKATAARVMSVALGGQTLLSAQAALQLGRTTLRVHSWGHWQLKGLEAPVRLFEVGDDDSHFTPPPDTAKAYRVVRRAEQWQPARAVRHNLPPPRDPFVGRQALLLELAQRFEAGARLVSVLGMAGIGKTRLALRFGGAWLGEFPGGVWFCDLSQARSADGIAQSVGDALGQAPGGADPVARVGEALALHGRCLVILDNFEQVARLAGRTLGSWLDQAPDARFIVTSRELLGLAGEQAFWLPPLPADEAAALFLRRAGLARPGFVPGPEDQAAIGPLVGLLEGLPLAIELAAARVRVMPPRTLLARMSERFKLLAASAPRQDHRATLRAAFDWSWDLLSQTEKSALAQLSAFDGGFTLEAAEAVLDLGGPEPALWPVDAVQLLLDKSLLRRRSDLRFELLGSVQEYAAEHLRSPGRFNGSGEAAAAAAMQRHLRWFAALDEHQAIADTCADLPNLVRACRRAAEQGDAGLAAAALRAAWAALRLRGPFAQGAELASSMLQALPQAGAAERARIERVQGDALQACGRTDEALRHFESALASAESAGDRWCAGRLHGHLGHLHAGAGRHELALAHQMQALALARSLADRGFEGEVLNDLGSLAVLLGHIEQARGHYQQALAVARAAAERRLEGGVLGNLGLLAANQGRLAEARAHFEASLALARALGDRHWEGNALSNLGLLDQMLGQFDRAAERLGAALLVARELGHGRLECVVLCNQGLVAEARGLPDEAQASFEAALMVARELGDRRSEGQFLGYLGALHARQGRIDEARACLDAGERLLRERGDPLSLGLLLCSRAEAEQLAGAPVAAREALAQAEREATTLGAGPESELGVALVRVRQQVTGGA